MPRIPDDCLLFCLYVFPTEDDAKKGSNTGGAGFFVGIRWELNDELAHVYAVTNWHVIKNTNPVIRFTDHGGNTVHHQTQAGEWRFPQVVSDLAVRLMETETYLHAEHLKVTLDDDVISQHDIGIGDEVFSPGRSLDIGRGERNRPVVRFGSIALMPEERVDGIPSYVVEMRSRTGFSGSPVYVYIPPAEEGLKRQVKLTKDKFYGPWLLGVHHRQLPIVGPDAPDDRQIGSGMCAVIPAKTLRDFIMNDRILQEERREVEGEWNARPRAIK